MNKSTKLFLIFLIFSLITVTVTMATWKNPIILISLLTLLATIKQSYSPIKRPTLTFIIFGLAGTTMEALIMLAGPWSYALPHLLNFPIWLPFLWGMAGTLSVTLYQAISTK
ncbi:MAG: hypothetical protein DPW11_01485 [bacterium]|nr:hypothetical protein [Candidatus Microgenomates bacterium CPR3]MCQ3944431.1 hypothetical protein [bacterium]RIK51693.1 MAG: hypothetical protein DCC61_01990 [Candidatus Microgenomates bacterium]